LLANQRGMTLIEVLAALLVLLVCTVSISTGLLTCQKQVASSQEKLTVLQLAQGKMEELMASDFRELEDIQPATVFPAPYTGYSYSVRVASDADYPAMVKIITVTVSGSAPDAAGLNSVSITGAKAWR